MKKTVQSINYDVPLSKYERAVDYLAIVLIFLLFVYTANNFNSVPNTIPTHFGFSGEPDSWGSRWTIWLLPLVALVVYGLLLLVDKFPQLINYPVKITAENGQRQYLLARMFTKTLRLAMVLVFCLLQWHILQLSLGRASAFADSFIALLVALVFIPVCLYMYLAIRAQ